MLEGSCVLEKYNTFLSNYGLDEKYIKNRVSIQNLDNLLGID